MRVFVFLCLMCWARSENKRPCLKFSQLSIKDSFKDLFNPQIEIFLIMYTRNNLNCPEPLLERNNSLNVNFNTSRKTVWLIHGYRPLGSIPAWLQGFLRSLLKHEDINIVVVDWNRGATTLIYDRAVKNTWKVAVYLSECIRKLLMHGASLANFHFIGMSLGAHISGFVGKIFQGQLGRITGLDPAGPKFSGKPPNGRLLHYTDAKFVDVIHSDIDGLGINEPLGHIDFYPNGGKKQPGCPKSIFAGIKFIKCNHQRAVYLFMAALETKCNIISFPCHSYKDYKTGSCTDCDNFKKSCPRLGYQAELWNDVLIERMRTSLRTTVFLDTAAKSPFCMYYFVLSIIVLDGAMKDGYVTFNLKNQLGKTEEPRLYKKNKVFGNLQEVKILAEFLNDVVNISHIGLTYHRRSNQQCSTCEYSIQSLMLKSLTYPERPPLCKHEIVLKENEEICLHVHTCSAEEL
ncbi:PREDICTED: lipase member I [Miniopterus natalensis]|uniref:lipase member I n=1 Tax=Miniopterus natalensis TaxID=291302 RepID=UPI0007A6F0D9|nr:PREDICTED: lipase member I [Miniopterus natalensis]